MTLFEILNFNKELLKRLVSAGFRTEDCSYIDMYTDYRDMKNGGGVKRRG